MFLYTLFFNTEYEALCCNIRSDSGRESKMSDFIGHKSKRQTTIFFVTFFMLDSMSNNSIVVDLCYSIKRERDSIRRMHGTAASTHEWDDTFTLVEGRLPVVWWYLAHQLGHPSPSQLSSTTIVKWEKKSPMYLLDDVRKALYALRSF